MCCGGKKINVGISLRVSMKGIEGVNSGTNAPDIIIFNVTEHILGEKGPITVDGFTLGTLVRHSTHLSKVHGVAAAGLEGGPEHEGDH